MPKLVLVFSLFSMALNISLTRVSLTGYESGINVSLVEAISGIVGQRDFIIGRMITVILLVIQVLILSKGSCRVSEVNARFVLETMNQKLYDIDILKLHYI